MSAQFTLLGPIDAQVGGAPVELGHVRQRSVLAVLLVEANRVVPIEALLAAVWGDQAPKRAVGALYSYLSRLRGCLATADEVTIVRRPGGYLLTTDPLTVDLHRFRHLVRAASETERDDAALAMLDEARALWRGEPFPGLDTPWFNSVRDALEGERRAADHDRVDTALRARAHRALLPELSARAAAEPLDERVAGQLILALYRAGQQAEALDHYESLRARLADAIGVDPGPELSELRLRILHADPALTGAAVVAQAPRQLPTEPPTFTGRAEALARLGHTLTGPDRPFAAISGAGGVGKSWLALRWAYDNLDRFPDGQLYANLRGFDPSAAPTPPAVALRGFLDALGVPAAQIPTDGDAQAALFRTTVAGRRLLIVLDNARDTEQVLPLLPGSPTGTVIVTSRNQLGGLVAAHGARPVAVDVLGAVEAREMVARLLGPARVAAEPASMRVITDRCAGLPLALGIVAARAALRPDFPLGVLADELEEAATRLDALSAGDLSADLRAVFAASQRALRPAAAAAFALLGLHHGPDIGLPAAAALFDLPPARARALLRELHEAHLVEEHVPGRYRLHDLVALYAAEQATDGAALTRLFDHYQATAGDAAARLDPSRTGQPDEAALAWFGTEHAVLMGVVAHAAESGHDRHAREIARALETFLDEQGHWHDWVTTQRTALAAARRLGERGWEADALRSIGFADTQLGHLAEADAGHRAALAIYAELGDLTMRAHTHRALGWVCDLEGRTQDGLDHNRRANELYREVGDRGGEALTLNNIGWLSIMLGDHASALTWCAQAVALNQELGDGHREAGAWDSLGYAHFHLGSYVDAIGCYERGLALVRGFDDHQNTAEILIHLGEAQQAAGDDRAAAKALQEAVTILTRLAHPRLEEIRANLAAVTG